MTDLMCTADTEIKHCTHTNRNIPSPSRRFLASTVYSISDGMDRKTYSSNKQKAGVQIIHKGAVQEVMKAMIYIRNILE